MFHVWDTLETYITGSHLLCRSLNDDGNKRKRVMMLDKNSWLQWDVIKIYYISYEFLLEFVAAHRINEASTRTWICFLKHGSLKRNSTLFVSTIDKLKMSHSVMVKYQQRPAVLKLDQLHEESLSLIMNSLCCNEVRVTVLFHIDFCFWAQSQSGLRVAPLIRRCRVPLC